MFIFKMCDFKVLVKCLKEVISYMNSYISSIFFNCLEFNKVGIKWLSWLYYLIWYLIKSGLNYVYIINIYLIL